MKNPLRLLSIILPVSAALAFSFPLSASDYGYLLTEDPLCSIWCAEGAYKVMKTDPPP